MTIADALQWAREYPNSTIMRSEVVRVLALAAGSGTAETSEDLAQCEASQSGGAKTPQRPERPSK